MKIYKNAWFERFARKQRIADQTLWDAIDRAEHGLVDADLGGVSSSSAWRGLVRGAPAGIG